MPNATRRRRNHVTPMRSAGSWGAETSSELMRMLGPVVYATRSADLIKIGWTSNLARRLNEIPGNRRGIYGVLAWQSGTFADEQAIHRRLSGLAVIGREYYPRVPEVLAVVNEMRAQMGVAPLN